LVFFEVPYLDGLEAQDEAVLEAVEPANVWRDFEHCSVACLAEIGFAEEVLVAVLVPHWTAAVVAEVLAYELEVVAVGVYFVLAVELIAQLHSCLVPQEYFSHRSVAWMVIEKHYCSAQLSRDLAWASRLADQSFELNSSSTALWIYHKHAL